ncbi:unnamed protein product, partial [Oikopleura dioica]
GNKTAISYVSENHP